MTRAAALLALLLSAHAFGGEVLSRERMVLRTEAGDIVVRFFVEKAPRHTEQFLKLARLGALDTVHICRIEPGFLVQTSSAEDRLQPLTKDQKEAIHPLKAEWSDLKHVRGMVNVGRKDDDPDSGETSFCFMLGTATHLDGKYTIMGQVDEMSLSVIDQFLRVPRDGIKPVPRLTVLSAFVVDSEELMSTFERVLPQRLTREGHAIEVTLPVSATVFRLMALILVAGLGGYLLGYSGRRTGVLLGQILQLTLAIAVFVCMWMPVKVSLEGEPKPHWEAFPLSAHIAGILALIAVVCAASILMRRRLQPRVQGSFNLLTVLLSGFAMFVISVPAAHASGVAALGLFVGLISIIKLMGNFESVT
jgi:cyclophilin family peptidyl-prolyl cis-trans isomerase